MHFLSLSFFIFQNIFFCIVGKSFLKILLVNMPKICRILREHSMATDFQCYVHGYTLRSIVKVGKQKFLLLLFLFILVSNILRAFSLFLSLSSPHYCFVCRVSSVSVIPPKVFCFRRFYGANKFKFSSFWTRARAYFWVDGYTLHIFRYML